MSSRSPQVSQTSAPGPCILWNTKFDDKVESLDN